MQPSDYRYSGPDAQRKFNEGLRKVMGLFYSDRFPPPSLLAEEAWEIIGKNQTERFVRLAFDWLKDGFRKDRIVPTLRDARRHASEHIARDTALTRNDARGGLAAIVSDAPGMSRKDRAIFAYTRAWMRQRQDLKVGDPGCAEQMQAFNDGMRDDDPRWVEEWHAVATHKEG